jgi:methylmalonyl-CoA mutase cobalamin-binding domain/chain
VTGAADRRPGRIVIGTLGLDQHEAGAMAISALLVRHGYEVIYLGRFNTPQRLAGVAAQEDADIVGVSVHSWEFTAYADDLLARCRDLGVGLIFGGSVLTEQDRGDLLARGADAVFGPYAPEDTMLRQIASIVDRVRASPSTPPGQASPQSGGPMPQSLKQASPVPPSLVPDSAVPEVKPEALSGRVVIVTGAARGLGRAYALELCRQGAAVVAADIDEAELKETAGLGGGPGRVHPVTCDITDPQAPRVLLDVALRQYGQLHGLVSNAGLLRSGPLLQLTDEDLGLLLDVHVTAAFRLLRVIDGYWRGEAKAGRPVDAAAVLTTSAAGLYGFRAEAAYSAAKAAVAMLTQVAADEVGRYGATVNAIAPAARTRMTGWLGERPGGPDSDPWAPEHVAPVVAWLLGPGAREVTGRVIEAGNGQISVPGSWRPGTAHPLPPLMSAAQAQALLPGVLTAARPGPGLLTPEAARAAIRPDLEPPPAS